jgi:colanic acid/amylovoran biosynthesis glycosyltransferase
LLRHSRLNKLPGERHYGIFAPAGRTATGWFGIHVNGMIRRFLPKPASAAEPVHQHLVCAGAGASRLRIAFLVHDFPVISETFIINQAAGLLERGHDLRIFAMEAHGAGSGEMHDLVDQMRIGERVSRPVALVNGRRHRRSLHEPRGAAPGLVSSLVERAAALTAEAAMMATHRRFDIVHCQFGTLGAQALRHAGLRTLRFRKLVVHVRGFDITMHVKENGAHVYEALFRRADRVIANCEHFRRRAIDLGCPPAKAIVVGSAIDCRRFAMKDDNDPAGRPVRVLAIGRLVEKKGFADAISAVAHLLRSGRRIELNIIGDGPLRAALQAQIDAEGASEAIRLLGARPQSAVVDTLRSSDILVAPSVTAASGDEDAPVNSIKEAMAVGLPVVATRHGGIPELVEDGRNGYLVAERDPAALADRMATLMDSPQNWRAMGRAGRAKVVAEFDQTVITDRIIAIYRDLLKPTEISHDRS